MVVSVPGHPVLLDSAVAAELDAAVVNVLDNVRATRGPTRTAYVLVEDLGDTVTSASRRRRGDRPAGRLKQAAPKAGSGSRSRSSGRLQRWRAARLSTERGGGTEWELTVPRGSG